MDCPGLPGNLYCKNVVYQGFGITRFYLLKDQFFIMNIFWLRASSFSLQLGQIEMYHVYVDGFLRTTVRASDKTRALVEGVDCARVSFIWLYSKTSKLYGLNPSSYFLVLPFTIEITATTSNKCEKCYSQSKNL